MASENLSSKTSLKFSLRFIFFVTTLVGIVCALLAPVVSSWPQAKQTTFLLILSAMALTTLATPFLYVFVRNYLERSAGEPLARVVGKRHGFIRSICFSIGSIAYAFACIMLLKLIENIGWEITVITISNFIIIFLCCLQAAFGIILLCILRWDGHVLEIRNEGIIHDTFFFRPWKSIKSFHWEGERLKLIKKRGTIDFSTHAADKPFIDQCLSKYLSREIKDE